MKPRTRTAKRALAIVMALVMLLGICLPTAAMGISQNDSVNTDTLAYSLTYENGKVVLKLNPDTVYRILKDKEITRDELKALIPTEILDAADKGREITAEELITLASNYVTVDELKAMINDLPTELISEYISLEELKEIISIDELIDLIPVQDIVDAVSNDALNGLINEDVASILFKDSVIDTLVTTSLVSTLLSNDEFVDLIIQDPGVRTIIMDEQMINTVLTDPAYADIKARLEAVAPNASDIEQLIDEYNALPMDRIILEIVTLDRFFDIVSEQEAIDAIGSANIIRCLDIKKIVADLGGAVEFLKLYSAQEITDAVNAIGADKLKDFVQSNALLEKIDVRATATDIIDHLKAQAPAFKQLLKDAAKTTFRLLMTRVDGIYFNDQQIFTGAQFDVNALIAGVIGAIPDVEQFVSIPAGGTVFSAVLRFDITTEPNGDVYNTYSYGFEVKFVEGVDPTEFQELISGFSDNFNYDVTYDPNTDESLSVLLDVGLPHAFSGIYETLLTTDRLPETVRHQLVLMPNKTVAEAADDIKQLASSDQVYDTIVENIDTIKQKAYAKIDSTLGGDNAAINKAKAKVDELLSKLTAKDSYDKAVTKLSSLLDRVCEKVGDATPVQSLYEGNGSFGLKRAVEVDFIKLIERFVSLPAEVPALFTSTVISADLDATVKIDGIYELTVLDKNGNEFVTYLPDGISMSVLTDATGYRVLDENAEIAAKMPAKDTALRTSDSYYVQYVLPNGQTVQTDFYNFGATSLDREAPSLSALTWAGKDDDSFLYRWKDVTLNAQQRTVIEVETVASDFSASFVFVGECDGGSLKTDTSLNYTYPTAVRLSLKEGKTVKQVILEYLAENSDGATDIFNGKNTQSGIYTWRYTDTMEVNYDSEADTYTVEVTCERIYSYLEITYQKEDAPSARVRTMARSSVQNDRPATLKVPFGTSLELVKKTAANNAPVGYVASPESLELLNTAYSPTTEYTSTSPLTVSLPVELGEMQVLVVDKDGNALAGTNPIVLTYGTSLDAAKQIIAAQFARSGYDAVIEAYGAAYEARPADLSTPQKLKVTYTPKSVVIKFNAIGLTKDLTLLTISTTFGTYTSLDTVTGGVAESLSTQGYTYTTALAGSASLDSYQAEYTVNVTYTAKTVTITFNTTYNGTAGASFNKQVLYSVFGNDHTAYIKNTTSLWSNANYNVNTDNMTVSAYDDQQATVVVSIAYTGKPTYIVWYDGTTELERSSTWSFGQHDINALLLLQQNATPAARPGFSFSWDKSIDAQLFANAGEIVINAVWTPIGSVNTTVSFKFTDENGDPFTPEQTFDPLVIAKGTAESYILTHAKTTFTIDWYEVDGITGYDPASTADAQEVTVKLKLAWYSASFYADDELVAKIDFSKNSTVPLVADSVIPAKEGFTAAWENYTLKPENITVHAVYTAIGAITDTDTGTSEGTDTTSPADTDDKSSPTNKWIGWLILIIILILIATGIVAYLALKPRDDDDDDNTPDPEPTPEPIIPVLEEDEKEPTPKEEEMSDETAISLIATKKVRRAAGKQAIVNISIINAKFEDGETVNLATLKEKRLIPANATRVKILASGTLTKALNIEADAFSVEAAKIILLAGGTITRIVSE